jgi:glycosyltransferase involved in cell wall biosynthesis
MSVHLYGWPYTLDYLPITKKTSTMSTPKISIIIPTLNQSETLEHTLLSIINQDYDNFEIIIVDGGSIDKTSSIVQRYMNWITYYISGKDTGQSNAINLGFAQASGNIYAWINSDDYYLPHAFLRVAKRFINNNINLVIGAGDVVSKDCKFLKHIKPMMMNRENIKKWSKGEWIMQQSCFWSSELWRDAGGVDESLRLLMDFDLWFRFSKHANSHILNEPLAAMRYYPEIKTVSLKDYVKAETAYVLAKNGELDELKELVTNLDIKNKKLSHDYEQLKNVLLIRLFRRLNIK